MLPMMLLLLLRVPTRPPRPRAWLAAHRCLLCSRASVLRLVFQHYLYAPLLPEDKPALRLASRSNARAVCCPAWMLACRVRLRM